MIIKEINNNNIDLLLSIVKSYINNENQIQLVKKQLMQEVSEVGDNRIIFIATDNDETVAMVQLVLKNADNDPELADGFEICHVHNLQVRKDFQKQGIGRMMMNHIEDQAKQLGKKIITLGVDGDNLRAIKLYKNRNYQIFKNEAGRTVDEILYCMKKEL